MSTLNHIGEPSMPPKIRLGRVLPVSCTTGPVFVPWVSVTRGRAGPRRIDAGWATGSATTCRWRSHDANARDFRTAKVRDCRTVLLSTHSARRRGTHRQEMLVLLNRKRLVATLVQMAFTGVVVNQKGTCPVPAYLPPFYRPPSLNLESALRVPRRKVWR